MPSHYPKSKLYFNYSNSTSETTALQNVWQVFPYPSTSINTIADSGDLVLSDDSGMKFTFTREVPAHFGVDVTCNIKKGSGGNANRNVQLVWEFNGVDFSFAPCYYMNNQDCIIVSSHAEIDLQNGDVLRPKIRNLENDDKIQLPNCQFIFKEDMDW